MIFRALKVESAAGSLKTVPGRSGFGLINSYNVLAFFSPSQKLAPDRNSP